MIRKSPLKSYHDHKKEATPATLHFPPTTDVLPTRYGQAVPDPATHDRLLACRRKLWGLPKKGRPFGEDLHTPWLLPQLFNQKSTRSPISHSGLKNCTESSLDSTSADSLRNPDTRWQSKVMAVLKATKAN